MVRMDPPKLVPPRTNVLINKDPRNLFWTPTEKFGPPHTDDKTQTLNIFDQWLIQEVIEGPVNYSGT